MSFETKNVQSTFQRAMTYIFIQILYKLIVIFIDHYYLHNMKKKTF